MGLIANGLPAYFSTVQGIMGKTPERPRHVEMIVYRVYICVKG